MLSAKRLCLKPQPIKLWGLVTALCERDQTLTLLTQHYNQMSVNKVYIAKPNAVFFNSIPNQIYGPPYNAYDDRKINIFTKCANFSSQSKPSKGDEEKSAKLKVPKLILIQNPLTWFMTKFDFVVLRSVWDPKFSEKDFKFGTKQAISRVTKLLSDGRYNDLSGLLTMPARWSLMRDMERTWTEQQRNLIGLESDDIQITTPRKVYFIRIADKKYCAVDMAFLALKWVSSQRSDGLVFTEIFARFHREYTPSCIPDWTIAYFKVTRFDILRRGQKK